MPGSCSSGLRSWPSGAGGDKRANGFDVASRNSRNPTAISPITASTRARSVVGRWRENIVTAAPQPASISDHNSSDPSCEPHVAAKR